MLALDPELVLAGGVAGVVADLKGGDDDGADGPGLLWGLRVERKAKATANAKDAEVRGGDVGGGDTWAADAHGGLLSRDSVDVLRITQMVSA
jgi:hypothetical protein